MLFNRHEFSLIPDTPIGVGAFGIVGFFFSLTSVQRRKSQYNHLHVGRDEEKEQIDLPELSKNLGALVTSVDRDSMLVY